MSRTVFEIVLLAVFASLPTALLVIGILMATGVVRANVNPTEQIRGLDKMMPPRLKESLQLPETTNAPLSRLAGVTIAVGGIFGLAMIVIAVLAHR